MNTLFSIDSPETGIGSLKITDRGVCVMAGTFCELMAEFLDIRVGIRFRAAQLFREFPNLAAAFCTEECPRHVNSAA